MKKSTEKSKEKGHLLKRILLIVLAIFILLLVLFGFYLSKYNTGNEYAKNLIENPSDGVTVEETDDTISFIPDGDIQAGVVFYPGAKITADAYTPIADALASNGYLCVLVNMPLNLAMLNSDAALDVEEDWPDVTEWYIAGHSMGGLAAEKCAYNNQDDFNGLIILASRIMYDFSDSDMPVLAIYATCDGICTPEVVAKSKETNPQPKIYTEVTIDGGCHGNFGSYGLQFMDDTPTISWEEQQQQVIEAMFKFLSSTK